ncbi:flippase [uncultured Coprobacter sp.]|jgi:flippase wzx|uniref:flippase n=1 Tax=uncultured Coprobacter sp. TaxID=1720550 RepID=UPI0025DA312E|nr:flippase [uncultured Coprobacter sp.]
MGVKKNVLYSTFLTGANYIFPLITYPYISRVLGPSNIGENEFALRIVGYFLLFASLGIATVGTREIAKCKQSQEECSRTFSSILVLNIISTILILVLYFICIYSVASFQRVRPLLLIGSMQIAFTPFLIEWLYKGVEDFPYITKRSLAVRILYVISIFIFVKTEEDLPKYFTLTICSMILNAVFNWGYKKKYVKFTLNGIKLRKYVKPYFTFGLYALLTSMYISFNVLFLGIVSTDIEVGYYSSATKLFSVVLAFFTSFSTVMMPRMSNMFANNDAESARCLIYKSFELLYPLAFTLILIGEFFAPQIIMILSGPGYEGAILPFRIILPLIFIIGTEQILIVQILTPMGKDKEVLINSIVGSIFGLVLNFIIVPRLGCTGSAIVWLCSEIAVFSSAFYFVCKAASGNIIPVKLLFKNIFLLSVPIIFILLMQKILLNEYIIMGISVIFVVLYTGLTQIFITKNSIICSVFSNIGHRKSTNI